MIVGFGRTAAPGMLGRRLVVRDAEQRLIDMTDRHAGRLRSELAERATSAAHEYRRDLTTAVDEAVETIRAAVDRATEDRRRGQRRADARLEKLSQIERDSTTSHSRCGAGCRTETRRATRSRRPPVWDGGILSFKARTQIHRHHPRQPSARHA